MSEELETQDNNFAALFEASCKGSLWEDKVVKGIQVGQIILKPVWKHKRS